MTMNYASPANGAGLPDETHCSVAVLAAEARKMIDLFEFCDTNKAVMERDKKEDAINESRQAAQEAASFFQANSKAGAIFQLGLIWDTCDTLAAELSIDKQEDDRFEQLRESVRRMCESVVKFISTDEADLRAGCVDYFLSAIGHHAMIDSAADQASREGRTAR
jgi:hypothetical protein